MGASVTSWVFFRRYFWRFLADLHRGSKIKYYKSRRIRWYQRGVQEKSFCLPILLPKVGPCQAKFRGRWESLRWWTMRTVCIVNDAFVARARFCERVMDFTWLCQTQVILYTTHGWSNCASDCCRSWWARVSLLGWFFEDISGDRRLICMVARKSNITSQGASAGINEVSRTNRFGFQFCFRRLVHAKQNFEVVENHYDDEKYNGLAS